MKKYMFFIALIALSLLPLVFFLQPGLPDTHDGVDHVARIANFYLNLQQGNIVPRWAPNLNWGFGHPVLMFLYPLPSYIASLFHLVGFSFVDSVKLVFAASFVASGISMYLWIGRAYGNAAGLVAGVAYLFAPYRFVDMYVRGALGEHVAFVFPPLICYFIFVFVQKRQWLPVVGGSLSTAGLLLSHNAISLMFFPLILLYMCFLLLGEKGKRNVLTGLLAIFAIGFALAGFFWIPAFFEGKYTLRDIVTSNEYQGRFETVARLLISPWQYGGTNIFSVQIGFVQWIGMIFAPIAIFLFYKKRKREWLFLLGMLFIFLSSTLFMLRISLPIWEIITILQKFQFPWRLLSVSVFVTAAALGLCVTVFPKRSKLVAASIVSVFLIVQTLGFWQAKGIISHEASYYTGIYHGTTDTGESAPIWSVRFMEQEPDSPSAVIEGSAEIEQTKKHATLHEYSIRADERSRIVENTLYFPGWRVYVDDQQVPLEFQDPRFRGLMTYFVDEGEHHVQVIFGETKLRVVANSISILAFVFLTFFTLYLLKRPSWQPFQ